MNYTENYHLPQWEETDRVMRTDFNQMCADIDQGIGTAQSAAASAKSAASSAGSSASSALATANQALLKANAAQKTADNAYSPDQKPYVVGSYVGTGARQEIQVGFKPGFIIISGQESGATDMDVLLATAAVNRSNITFHATFFRLFTPDVEFPRINIEDRTYHFIAFR